VSERALPHGYATPEEAALSGYSVSMQPRVLRVEAIDGDADRVNVHVDTVPSHPMTEYCERIDDLWRNLASTSG
jgi:hypothetical protein